MPRQTRYSNRDAEGEEPRARRAPASQGLPMAPIVVLVVLLAGALFFARMIAQSNQEEDARPEVVDDRRPPFAELPREGQPVTSSSNDAPAVDAPNKSYPPAPRGVVDTNSTWLSALQGATEAEALFAKAQAAKQSGDHSGFRENGIAAKKLYTEIIDDTRQLEEELLEQYGEGNAEINALIKKRNEWSDRRQILSKTTGR